MRAQLIRIGNSRGIRLPQKLLSLYRLEDGDGFSIEQRREGILLRPEHGKSEKIGWEESYAEMAAERAESYEWAEWDALSGDGVHD